MSKPTKSENQAWKTTYDVVIRSVRHEDGDYGSYLSHVYDVVDKFSGTVHGTYKDHKYANKQARRKYQRLVRLMERSLMT